jgi:hypothetical protein
MRNILFFLTFLISLVSAQSALASDVLRPFIQGSPVNDPSVEAIASQLEKKLTAAGFELAGKYVPYQDAVVLGVTSNELKSRCGNKKNGGFAAVMRVAVTKVGSDVEISYTNPDYFGHAYQVGSLNTVTRKLESVLGNTGDFGSEDGIKAKALGKWHYMFGMPYFDDAVELKKYATHEEAVNAVKKGLSNSDSDMQLVWEVRISDNQTKFGVQLNKGYWENNRIKEIMAMLDNSGPKKTASLPWEILVYDKTVVYLPGKYRIALVFPDLGMGDFMKISNVPGEMDKSAKKIIKLSE